MKKEEQNIFRMVEVVHNIYYYVDDDHAIGMN